MRVSLAGYNALTETAIDNYSIYSDSDNVLIKEHSRGSATVTAGATETITHSLGYVPFYILFYKLSGNSYWEYVSSFSNGTYNDNGVAHATTTALVFVNRHATLSEDIRYIIFYDQQV